MSTTDSTPDANENASEQGQDVSTIELFFDLVFVFAFTQVTGFLAHHLTWAGVAKGAALLAAVWWAWVMYSWLTGAVSPQENLLQRVVIFAAMAAMLVVALSVPGAFETTALLFAVAYFVVRLLHIALYTAATPPETRDAVLRAAPGFWVARHCSSSPVSSMVRSKRYSGSSQSQSITVLCSFAVLRAFASTSSISSNATDSSSSSPSVNRLWRLGPASERAGSLSGRW